MADVSPAARSPAAKKYRAQAPSSGSSWTAMSAALAISASRPTMAADVATMAMLTSAPTTMLSPRSSRAAGRSSGPSHRSRTADACRNRLYGTTVVPTSPATYSIPAESGTEGTNSPRSTSSTGGRTTTAVARNASAMRPTSATRTRSTTA